MKINAILIMLVLTLMPVLSEARCRTIGESASIGTEYGTFPMYPAVRVVEAGQEQGSIPLQWLGYGLGAPLFLVSLPFGMAGAVVGATLHPWTKCNDTEPERR